MFSFFTVEFKVPVPCILERNSHSLPLFKSSRKLFREFWVFGLKALSDVAKKFCYLVARFFFFQFLVIILIY